MPDLKLSNDRLVGALAIAKFRGEPIARTRYLVRIRAFPFYREGRVIIASKAALRQHHVEASRAAAASAELAPGGGA